MSQFLLIFDVFDIFLYVILSLWWVWLPVFLYSFSYFVIISYTNLKYRLSLEWVLLELKIPKEPNKSPKAMEQVFAGLHGVYTTSVKWHEYFFEGRMLDWFSLEISGYAGETHFYIRTQSKYKNLVESQIYAQYPEAEVAEVPDYVNRLPMYLPDERYDLWGTDLILNKEDAYPIRTYPDFEEKSTRPDDVKRIDPLASLSELFSTLHPDEQIWIQIIATPVSDGWVKRGQVVVDRLMGKETPSTSNNFLSDAVFAIDKAISGIGSATDQPEKKEEKKHEQSTPGKQDAIKAIEKSFDKLGYECGIRFIYIGPRAEFHQAHVAGVMGSFKQFSSQNLNGFKVNLKTLTFAKGLFKKSKLLMRKKSIYQAFKERKVMLFKYVLNTEELATIFHFPDTGVKSPLLPRVDVKKGEPPVGLPLS